MIGLTWRTTYRLASAVVFSGALWTASATAPAHAGDCSVPISGTYTAFSDGVWAQTNYRFHDEAPVTSTWTVTSNCSTYLDCTGNVVTDAGWSAPVVCGLRPAEWCTSRT